MRIALRHSFFLLLAMALAACTGGGNHVDSRDLQPDDTVYTEKAVLEIYGHDPQRALTLIDSGLMVGSIEPDRATLLRARVYCYSPNEWPLDTVNQMLEGLLESDFAQENPGNRQSVLDLLVYASRRRGDNVAYLRWATEKADLCRQQGDETEALRTEAEIGAVLTSMGEVEKGLSKLDGVIGALDKQRHFNEMDACIIALKRRIYVLCDIDRYDEVIPLANRIIEKLNDYREHPEDYNDGSFRLPRTEEKRLDYCNFYTSQAYGFLMIAYGDLGTLDSSRYYLSLFERSDYSKTLVGKMMLAPAYLRLGQYGKVQPLYDEIEACMGADTLNSDYALILRGRAIMAEAAGNYYAANSYGKRYNNLKELLNKQLLESRAYEYSARYHLLEVEAKLEAEKQRAADSRRKAIALSVSTLVALAFVVALLVALLAIRRKNKLLAEQFDEIVKAKRESSKVNDEADDVASDNLSPLTSHLSPQEMTDEQLFQYLSNIIRSEKLFTNPTFGRQAIADRFHLSDRRIGAAFAHGSLPSSGASQSSPSSNDAGTPQNSPSKIEGVAAAGGRGRMTSSSDDASGKDRMSLPVFLRELRLDYACRLLVDCPDMTINDIAAASGFGSPIVFHRVFKTKYEITPTYYRSQVKGDPRRGGEHR